MNHSNSSARRSTRPARLGLLAVLLAGAATGAFAQYKIVGPDGKVTYTDKPPTAADMRSAKGTGTAPAGGNGGMPYETRQAMTKYPVTLYASASCDGCDKARQALRQRGVPFSEYSVSSNADVQALQSRFGDSTVPVLSIGSQAVKGFSAPSLASYLDAAGYPAQAHLSGYSWPAAQPLTSPAPVAAKPVAPVAAPSAPEPLLPPPSKSGIQF